MNTIPRIDTPIYLSPPQPDAQGWWNQCSECGASCWLEVVDSGNSYRAVSRCHNAQLIARHINDSIAKGLNR